MRRDLLLIPNDSLKSENFSGNGVDTVVGVTVRGTPVLGKPTARRVVDDLHRPSELSDEINITEGGHVRVRPGVHGNIILMDRRSIISVDGQTHMQELTIEDFVCSRELLRVVENVDTDVEMSGMFVVLFKELIELI